MDNEYNYVYPGTNISLKEVQEIEYDILVEFDRVSRILNTPYQLFAGTLLGAVRHKDFIPWDDDIDVCMLREDFDRFISESENILGEKYFLQTSKTDPKSVVQFAKIRKNGTVYENSVDNLPNSHTGIWIDIFPLDKTKAGTIYEKIQSLEVKVLYALITSTVPNRVSASPIFWKKIIRHIFHWIMQAVPKELIEKQLYKVMTRYNNNDDVEYLRNFANGSFLDNPKRVIKLENFYDMFFIKFHEAVFPVPRNYDKILTGFYGNYMNLPPIEKRIPSHGVKKIVLSK